MIDIYFRKSLLNIRPSAYNFLVIVCHLYDLQATAARLLFDPDIDTVRKGANLPNVKHS